MRYWSSPVLTLVLCYFASYVAATYLDDAYHNDYHHALLGTPQAHTSIFHRPSAQSKAALLYTLSVRGVLGAVNPKDGALLWRHILGNTTKTDSSKGILLVDDKSNLIISGYGAEINAWDSTDGRLVWNWRGSEPVKALELVDGVGSPRRLAIVSQSTNSNLHGSITCLSSETGALKWQKDDVSGDMAYDVLSVGHQLFYISLHHVLMKGFRIKVQEFDANSGTKSNSFDVTSSENDVHDETSVLAATVLGGSPAVVYCDKAFKSVKVHHILGKHTMAVQPPRIQGQITESLRIHLPPRSAVGTMLAISCHCGSSSQAEVFALDLPNGVVKSSHAVSFVKDMGTVSFNVIGTEVYLVRYSAAEISLLRLPECTVIQSWKTQLKPYARGVGRVPSPQDAVSELMKRSRNDFSIRSALTLTDGDWELVRNGEHLWTRPESLTDITAALWIEGTSTGRLAKDLAVESQSNAVFAYLHRLRRHVKAAQNIYGWAEQTYHNSVSRASDSDEPIAYTSNSKFGFDKTVVVATKRGQVAALDMGQSGKVLWKIDTSEGALVAASLTSLDIHPDDPNTVVMQIAGDKVLHIDTKNGFIIRQHTYETAPDPTRMETRLIDHDGHHVPVTVDTGGTPQTGGNFMRRSNTTIITKTSLSTLTGWSGHQNGAFSRVWAFSAPRGHILQVIHRPSHDPIASIGKALGDRNVLYKYLSPNIALVTTGDFATQTMGLYLLDTVSGSVLHAIRHEHVDFTEPISTIMAENTITYTLSSTKIAATPPSNTNQKTLKGTRLFVAELYESRFSNQRSALRSHVNSSAVQPFEGQNGDLPYIISQSFMLPEAISHMSTTSTLQGITPRTILCVSKDTGGIFAIPRYVVEARRPVGRDPTAAELEEGLMRYSAMLELDPKWSISHKREFLQINNVITTPSKLESTSLVFAYGDFDIFGTRISPIGSYDMLGKGFSRTQLLGTVLILAIGTGLLAPFVKRKQVNARWIG